MDYSTEQLAIEILTRLGLPVQNKNKYNIHCPEHPRPDKNPSCTVTLNYNGNSFLHCWSCGFHTTLKNYYYEMTGHSIYTDLDIVYNKPMFRSAPVEIDLSITPDTDFEFEGRLFSLYAFDIGKQWLSKRGFENKIADKYGIKYAKFGVSKKKSDKQDKEHWTYIIERAIIPIYENKKLICFEARDLQGEEAFYNSLKAKNIEDVKYKKVLYPNGSSTNTIYQFDKLDQTRPLYITEGILDCMSLQTSSEFDNCSAIFHAIPTTRQYYLLNKFPEVIYVIDNDEPGLYGAKALYEKINNKLKILRMPRTIKDPNDILQGKHPSIKTISDLVSSGWLKKIIRPDQAFFKSAISQLN